jgi:hypothetical protein
VRQSQKLVGKNYGTALIQSFGDTLELHFSMARRSTIELTPTDPSKESALDARLAYGGKLPLEFAEIGVRYTPESGHWSNITVSDR